MCEWRSLGQHRSCKGVIEFAFFDDNFFQPISLLLLSFRPYVLLPVFSFDEFLQLSMVLLFCGFDAAGVARRDRKDFRGEIMGEERKGGRSVGVS